jgi:hypothetical protein
MSKKEPICPLLKKPCIEHGCAWYAHIEGKHPQSGAILDTWACSIPWIPIMSLENARQTRGVQAAVESFRNESIDRQDALNTTLVATQIMPAINGMKELPKLEE